MGRRPPQWTPENASRFQDRSVVDAYHLRLPYPPEIFDKLVELIDGAPRTVLDVGTGTGELARPLAARADRVDAVDLSGRMIARGAALPGGDHPNLRWIEGALETVSLQPGYALITAGDSLHWMDWDVVLPRFDSLLVPGGHLAIVHRTEQAPPWKEGLTRLIATYSTSIFYETFDLIGELVRRGLFEQMGTFESRPVTTRQEIGDYIESFHSRSSFSREHMPADAPEAFDQELRELVDPWIRDGALELTTVGNIEWGRPGRQ